MNWPKSFRVNKIHIHVVLCKLSGGAWGRWCSFLIFEKNVRRIGRELF